RPTVVESRRAQSCSDWGTQAVERVSNGAQRHPLLRECLPLPLLGAQPLVTLLHLMPLARKGARSPALPPARHRASAAGRCPAGSAPAAGWLGGLEVLGGATGHQERAAARSPAARAA